MLPCSCGPSWLYVFLFFLILLYYRQWKQASIYAAMLPCSCGPSWLYATVFFFNFVILYAIEASQHMQLYCHAAADLVGCALFFSFCYAKGNGEQASMCSYVSMQTYHGCARIVPM